MERAADLREAPSPDPGARVLFALLLVLLLAPCAVLAYLPMTDLPQHLAAVSILRNLGDPRFGFAAFYEPAWDHTLYALPYLLTLGLAPLVSIEVGMRIVVVLSLALLPIGVFALLRALGKPGWLALLSLPIVYNRLFFWGFVNNQLALGFALLALAILVRPAADGPGAGAIAALCTLIVLTHPYGILMLAGYSFLWLLLGERRALARHALGLSPLLIGVLGWALWAGATQEPRPSRSRRCSSASTTSRSPCWAATATPRRRGSCSAIWSPGPCSRLPPSRCRAPAGGSSPTTSDCSGPSRG